MTTVEKCDVWVYPPGHRVGWACGRKVKADGMCGLHLAAHQRREAKAAAAKQAEAEQREARREMQRRETLALNLAQFLTDALGVQFEAAYGGLWLDTDQGQKLLATGGS